MKKDIEWNVPLWVLLGTLLMITGNILIKINSNNYLPLVITANIISFLCFYMVLYCWYYLGEILVGKCRFCGKGLENRTGKAMKFMLTPPWKKRKVKFVCRDCKIKMIKKRTAEKIQLIP